MTLKLRNSWKYKGKDWWEWEAFVDGKPNELDDIKHVEYVLHESFRDPVRRIDDRQGGFRLSTEGWGEFKLKAFVRTKDGKKVLLEHEIELQYDPREGISD